MVQQIGLIATLGAARCNVLPRSSHQLLRQIYATSKCKKLARHQYFGRPVNRTFIKEHQIRNMCAAMAGTGSNVAVTVEPSGHLLMDEELHIRVHGLDSGQEVTIHTLMKDGDKSIDSCCQFRADSEGVVHLYSHPSLGGSYTGISPMGIFWSLAPTPEMQKGFRLIFKDVDKPLVTELSVYSGILTAEDVRSKKPTAITKHVIERWYKGQGVTSTEVTDGRIRGTLFLPPGPGPFPGVIDLFGTVGGIVEFRSALLASRGFASLALPYFAYKDLPEYMYDIDLDYFLEAISWLRGHPKVYGEGIGAVGVSKGGDLSLMMAAHCPQVRAVVNINGCTFNSIFSVKYSGGDIPCVPMDIEKMDHKDDVYWMKNCFDYKPEDLTPVWNHNPKVLNIVSEDDYCAPPECAPFMQRHYPRDKVDNFTILSYPDAGHLLEPPYTPCCDMSYHKGYGMYFKWGGTPKHHAHAQEDAWRNILKFLHANVPQNTATSKL